jgi:hypothetical protein
MQNNIVSEILLKYVKEDKVHIMLIIALTLLVDLDTKRKKQQLTTTA